MKKTLLAAFLVAAAYAGSAAAGYTYVGSWQVDQGPYWYPVPPAYTCQEAAALLFGGNAAQYVTSTVDANPADINFQSWISTWGGACGGNFPCGTLVPDNAVVSTGGTYATWGDQSTYVLDWAQGSQYTNYAFVSNTPIPAAIWLVGSGLVGLFGFARRKV